MFQSTNPDSPPPWPARRRYRYRDPPPPRTHPARAPPCRSRPARPPAPSPPAARAGPRILPCPPAPFPSTLETRPRSEARYISPPAASKIVAMTHEVVEHYSAREEENRIADLRRSGMEIVFGDPEDRPCDLLPPEAFSAPEDIRPDPEVRRRGGTSDEETGRNSRAVYWRFFSSCAGWPCPPHPGSSTMRSAKRTRTGASGPSCVPGFARPPTAKFSGAGSRKRIRGPCSWPPFIVSVIAATP